MRECIYCSAILDLGNGWKWVFSFTLQPLHPQRKSPRYQLYRRLGGPQTRSGRCEVNKNVLPCGESKLGHPAPSSSLYWLRYPGYIWLSHRYFKTRLNFINGPHHRRWLRHQSHWLYSGWPRIRQDRMRDLYLRHQFLKGSKAHWASYIKGGNFVVVKQLGYVTDQSSPSNAKIENVEFRLELHTLSWKGA
jgi:hypothetical protein